MVTRPSSRLGIVTGEKAPRLTDNGRAVLAELRERGWSAEPVVWTDEGIDWADFDVALVRSCWQYHTRPDAFRKWLRRVENADVTLRNPARVARWNMHKFYLRDLADEGVPILPTAWVERGSDADLRAILRENDWERAVVKPAVGTGSAKLWRTSESEAAEQAERFDAFVADGDVLVQQFAPEIADGERSLVFFGGEFSHARRRYPAEGDFRAHNRYGGTGETYDPPRELVERATAVLRTAREIVGVSSVDLPYDRVDGVEREGEFRLMELELVEPYLSLDSREGSVTAFADAIESSLSKTGP